MTSRLHFEAPADLSVGRVTLMRGSVEVANWLSTPGRRTIELSSVQPGVYIAAIAPVGLRPRSFVFEVRSTGENIVKAPSYGALLDVGYAAAFSKVADPQAALRELLSQGATSVPVGFTSTSDENPSSWSTMEVAPERRASRAVSIGLSQDQDLERRGGWRPYAGPGVSVELVSGNLRLEVHLAADVRQRYPRMRLALALAGVREERMLLPLFTGGTRAIFHSSSTATADLAVRIVPVNAERRALVQALYAGTIEETRAVRDDVLGGEDIRPFIERNEDDPSTVIVVLLLTLRFPELFAPVQLACTSRLIEAYPWACDGHVLHARALLASSPDDERAQKTAAREALKSISRAQRMGAPYFAYTNQMIGETLGALAQADSVEERTREQAQKELIYWRAELALQRTAGAAFSWQRSDGRERKESGTLTPYVATRGHLDPRYTSTLFHGEVDLSRIRPRSSRPAGTSSDGGAAAWIVAPSAGPVGGDPPALQRPITVPDDPNKGRFGGKAQRDGYELSATFTPVRGSPWITIRLSVRAAPDAEADYSNQVEFFLHPTFNPDRIRSPFRNREAFVTVTAWGGFTVGAWLPGAGVELECDLAQLEDAPKVIREL